MKLVLVEWVDSAHSSGWHILDEISKLDSLQCRSVGWVLTDTKEQITLISSIASDPDQACGSMVIPRRAITKLTTLRKG